MAPRLVLLPLVLSLAACGPSMPQLRAQASKDLNCPVSEVDIGTAPDKNMYASCYGEDATYHSTCEGEEGCRWIRNPEPEADADADADAGAKPDADSDTSE